MSLLYYLRNAHLLLIRTVVFHIFLIVMLLTDSIYVLKLFSNDGFVNENKTLLTVGLIVIIETLTAFHISLKIKRDRLKNIHLYEKITVVIEYVLLLLLIILTDSLIVGLILIAVQSIFNYFLFQESRTDIDLYFHIDHESDESLSDISMYYVKERVSTGKKDRYLEPGEVVAVLQISESVDKEKENFLNFDSSSIKNDAKCKIRRYNGEILTVPAKYLTANAMDLADI